MAYLASPALPFGVEMVFRMCGWTVRGQAIWRCLSVFSLGHLNFNNYIKIVFQTGLNLIDHYTFKIYHLPISPPLTPNHHTHHRHLSPPSLSCQIGHWEIQVQIQFLTFLYCMQPNYLSLLNTNTIYVLCQNCKSLVARVVGSGTSNNYSFKVGTVVNVVINFEKGSCYYCQKCQKMVGEEHFGELKFIPQNTEFNYVKMEREPNESNTMMINGQVYSEQSFQGFSGQVKAYLTYCGQRILLKLQEFNQRMIKLGRLAKQLQSFLKVVARLKNKKK